MKDALGLVEVAGLASAIQVADVMVKSANVTMIDIEKAKGNGWMTVKVRGDVGAVQAAVQAGAAEAQQFGHLIAQKVIPRPAEGLDTWLLASGGETVLQGISVKAAPKPEEVKEAKEAVPVVTESVTPTPKQEKAKTKAIEPEATADETKSALLEVFKPGSTAKANTTSVSKLAKINTSASSPAKATPKKRTSRAKSTKPKA